MNRICVNALSRREFLQESAVAASAIGLTVYAGAAEAQKADLAAQSGVQAEPLRIGIIGPGSQGQADLRKAVKVPGLQCVAACDIFEPNLNAAKQIAKITDENTCSDYRKLLDRKDIQAVMVTVPLPLHAKITIDALEAGKHVFCEKLMAYTVDECKRMARTAKRTGKVLQIGHQRSSSIGYNHAYELVNSKKVCGKVTHIRAQWNRNGSWRRTVPKGNMLAGQDYWHDLEHLVNWRLYKRTSQGLMAELASHQIQVVNWFLNSAPTAVVGVGGIDYWKDGRDVWDNVQTIFEYPGGIKVTYQSLTTNQFDGFQEEFMGDRGTLITTVGDKGMDKGLLYREPRAEVLDWAQFTEKEKGANGKEGIVLNASATKKLNTGAKIGEQTLSTAGDGKDAYDLEFYNWAAAIREGKHNYCDPEQGIRTAVAMLKANEAMERQTRVVIPDDLYTV